MWRTVRLGISRDRIDSTSTVTDKGVRPTRLYGGRKKADSSHVLAALRGYGRLGMTMGREGLVIPSTLLTQDRESLACRELVQAHLRLVRNPGRNSTLVVSLLLTAVG